MQSSRFINITWQLIIFSENKKNNNHISQFLWTKIARRKLTPIHPQNTYSTFIKYLLYSRVPNLIKCYFLANQRVGWSTSIKYYESSRTATGCHRLAHFYWHYWKIMWSFHFVAIPYSIILVVMWIWTIHFSYTCVPVSVLEILLAFLILKYDVLSKAFLHHCINNIT